MAFGTATTSYRWDQTLDLALDLGIWGEPLWQRCLACLLSSWYKPALVSPHKYAAELAPNHWPSKSTHTHLPFCWAILPYQNSMQLLLLTLTPSWLTVRTTCRCQSHFINSQNLLWRQLAVNWAYIRLPDNHIGWANSMPLASIDPTHQRTSSWKFDGGGWKTQFFWVSHFEKFLSNFFFCFISI